MCTYIHVLLYCMLFYLYLLCSRKANFYAIHRQYRFCILFPHSERIVNEGNFVTLGKHALVSDCNGLGG